MKGGDHLRDLLIYWRIILKQDVRISTGFIRLRIKFTGDSYEHGNHP
jgi:hypothetical protein